jgi:hypothetical protein
MNWKRHVTKRETLERIRVVGPMERSEEVMRAMHDEGWNIKRSGPWQRVPWEVDQNRFLFIAEKAVSK